MYNILIIDDEKLELEGIIEYIMVNSPLEIINQTSIDYTTDSEKALEMLKKKQYHIIATDFRMPKINGHQLLLAAKEIQAYSKAIMFSAYTDKQTVQDLFNSGLIDISIDKPFKAYEFRDCLFRLIDKCKEEATNYEKSIDTLAQYVLKGKKIPEIREDILKAVVNQGKGKITEISEKTGINRTTLYKYYQKKTDTT